MTIPLPDRLLHAVTCLPHTAQTRDTGMMGRCTTCKAPTSSGMKRLCEACAMATVREAAEALRSAWTIDDEKWFQRIELAAERETDAILAIIQDARHHFRQRLTTRDTP